MRRRKARVAAGGLLRVARGDRGGRIDIATGSRGGGVDAATISEDSIACVGHRCGRIGSAVVGERVAGRDARISITSCGVIRAVTGLRGAWRNIAGVTSQAACWVSIAAARRDARVGIGAAEWDGRIGIRIARREARIATLQSLPRGGLFHGARITSYTVACVSRIKGHGRACTGGGCCVIGNCGGGACLDDDGGLGASVADDSACHADDQD